MIKLAAISPKTVNSQEQQGVGSPEEEQLKQLFTDLAYGMLEGKAPNVVPNVTDFRVLEVNIQDNKAVGAFSLQVGNKKAMIPIVMSEGKVKPPELIYSEQSKTYVPLSDKWVNEMSSPDSNYLGKSAKAPKTLSSDMDVRALTLPPSTGRFVYASYDRTRLLRTIDSCDDTTKLAFSDMLRNSAPSLRAAMKYHGSDIVLALKPSFKKEASGGSRVFILDTTSSLEDFESAFGSAKLAAYKIARDAGVVTRDLREWAKVAVNKESPLNLDPSSTSGLTSPRSPGLYTVVTSGGKKDKVVIIPNPFTQYTLESGVIRDEIKSYLVIRPTGRYALIRGDILAIPDSTPLPPTSRLAKAISGYRGEVKNGMNLFIGVKGDGVTNAVILEDPIKRVVKNSDGFTAMSGGTPVVVTTSKGVSIPKRVAGILYIPGHYVGLKVSKVSRLNDLLKDVEQLSKVVSSKLDDVSDDTLKVAHNRAGNYWICDGLRFETPKDLLTKVASLGINVDVIRKDIPSIMLEGTKRYSLFSPKNLTKLSSIFGPEPQIGPPPGGMAPPPGGMAPPPGGMPAEGPQMMEAAAGLGDQEMFDSAATAQLIASNPFNEAVANELPSVEKAMDSVARILVSIQLKETSLLEQLGPEEFARLEENLRKVLGGLGDIILSVHSQRRMSSLPEGELV